MGALSENELDKERALLQGIIRATNEERIRWLPTAKLNEYTGSFNGRWSILVGQDTGKENKEHYVQIEDDHGSVVLRLTSGEVREAASALATSKIAKATNAGSVEDVAQIAHQVGESGIAEANDPVRQLFEAVSRKAFHSDKRIEEFLQDLKRA